MRRKIFTILCSGLMFLSVFFAPQANSSTFITGNITDSNLPSGLQTTVNDNNLNPTSGNSPSSGELSELSWLNNSTQNFQPMSGNQPLSGKLFANTIRVTREDDPDNGIGNCLILNSNCSLRQAINYANSTPDDDIIDFASNVHVVRLELTINNPSDPADPRKDVLISLNGSLTIQGPGANLLTITRAVGKPGRIFSVEKGTSNVFNMSGVTLEGGNGEGRPFETYPRFGGAMITKDVALSLNSVVLRNNSVQNKGGALALTWGRIDGTTSTLTVNITDSFIQSNTAGVGCGGIVTLTTIPFAGQTATMLGGTLNITNTVIDQNTASGSSTGGGLCANFEFTNITNSQITGNLASRDGGGIDVDSAGNNVNGTLTVRNSTISGNRLTNAGDGAGIHTFQGNVVLEHATVAFNQALIGFSEGGGIYNGTGQITIHNSIIAKNTDSSTNCPDVCGAIHSNGYNIIGRAAGGSSINGGSLDFDGNPIGGPGDLIGGYQKPPVDPLLGTLDFYGGSTKNHSLPCNSPAMNAGDPSSFLSTDQRGVLRPQGARVDMGSYESFECYPTVHNSNDSGADSLRDVINRSPDGKTVSFSPTFFNQPRTIGLTSELLISKNLTIDGSANSLTISGNNQTRIFNIVGGVTVNLNKLTLTGGNSAGGSAINNNGTVNLTNSTITGNQATGEGGGITNAGSMSISNSTISGNSAPNSKGGGIYNLAPSNLGVTTTNVTISNNTAKFGGGVFNESGTSSVFSARNTIFAGNIGTTRGPDFDGGLNSLGYNLIGNTDWTGIGGNTTGNKTSVSAQLGPLGNYGGPTQTHILSCVSPAVDAGDPNNVLSTDQRGIPRPFQGRADMGAYEITGSCELLVNEPGESGSDTLRQQIANIHYGGRIRINVSSVSVGGEILIDKALTIEPVGSSLKPITGNNQNRIFNLANGAAVNLLHLQISGGNSSGNGGAILINPGATLNATTSIFQNSVAASGGAIYNAGTLNLINVLLSGNSAAFGGAVANEGTATINNSTLANNTATDNNPGTDNKGGAMYLTGADNSIVNTTNVTISGNHSASYGGGVYVEASGNNSGYNLRNTIIAGNTAGQLCPDVSAMSRMYSYGYNLIDKYGSSFCNQWDGSSPTLAGNIVNPTGGARLAPLGDYGGPTQTFALLSNSPAIDAGDPNNVVGATDQRSTPGSSPCATAGSPRLIDGNKDGTIRVDIGAYEQGILFDQTSLPSVRRAEAYNQVLTARTPSCGSPVSTFFRSPYSIIPINGQSLPPGITLAGDGTLSGAPTTPGTYTFTVKVVDIDRMASAQEFTIVVDEGTSFSIDDVTHNEGNSGTTAYTFTVTKTGPGAANVSFATVDDTATVADNDYQANSGTISFGASDTTKQITVLVNGDTKYDRNETFKVHLSTIGGAFFTRADGVGTILNDDCIEPTSGLATWYPGEGNLNDVVGNQNGTVVRAPLYVTGKIGNAFHFDGTTGNSEAFFIPRQSGDDFTISFWLRATALTFGSLGQWNQGAGIVAGDDFGVSFANGRVLFGIGSNTIRAPGPPAPTPPAPAPADRIADGNWHHVAVTRDRNTGELRIFIDGGLRAAGFGGTHSLNTSNLYVGSLYGGGANFYRGDLDEIQLFTRALDPAEVADLYTAGTSNLGTCQSSTLEFSAPTFSVAENGTAAITVTRSGVRSTPAAINYATVTGGTATGDASCSVNTDYLNTSGTLNFASGEESKTFNVPFCNDSVFEPEETISLALSNATGDGVSLGSQVSAVLTIQNDDPTPPTDLALWNNSLPENSASGTIVGALSTTDPNPGDTFTYTLVSGTGSSDNASFTISGNELKTNALLDFETKNINHIRVRTTDQSGLFFEKEFTINVTNVNEAPTDLALSKNSIPENNAVNAVFGTFTTTDQDANNTHAYSLVSGAGSADNSAFTVSGNQLLAAVAFDFETKSSYDIRVRTVDQSGLFFEKQFNLTIINVNEAPTLNAINNPADILEDAGQQTVSLSGISSGPASENNQTLTITAASDNTALIPNPTVTYTSPNATGSLTYTPVANANGSAIITVTVKDNGGLDNGGADTFQRTFTVNVTSVNDAPSFIKGADQTVNEDAGTQTIDNWATAVSKGPTNESSQTLIFNVTNNNNSLFSSQPAVDSSGKLTYTPAANANGSAAVQVTLSDNGGTDNGGDNTADTQTFTITVNAINDAPTLDAISNPADIAEDSGLQIVNLNGITAGIPADENSQTLTVTASSDNASLIPDPTVVYTSPNAAGLLSYTPVANTAGTAVITVTVTDGGGVDNGGVNTFQRTFTVKVTEVNDAPTAAGDLLSDIAEDSGQRTIPFTNLTANDNKGAVNESSQTLIVKTVSNPVGGSVSISGTNVLFTPTANYNGAASFDYIVEDNGTTSGNPDPKTSAQAAIVSFNIFPVNDQPTLNSINDPTATLEDAGQQTINLSGITSGAANESSQTLTVTATSDNVSLIPNPIVNYTSPNATGTLTYTPVADASGTAQITLTIQDSGGTANGGSDTFIQKFTVKVSEVNDAPTSAADTLSDIAEDSGQRSIPFADLTGNDSKGPANESSQALIVKTVNNPVGGSVIVNGNSVLFTPTADYHGAASFNYTVEDNGTTNGVYDPKTSATSAAVSFNIVSVNDAPTLNAINNPANILEDSGQQTINLSGISAGATNESSQTLTITAASDNTALIPNPSVTYTSPNATGSLTYTPVANANGSAIITVTVKDNGGLDNGGADTFQRTFTVNVTSVNDAPSFIKGGDHYVPRNAGPQAITNWATDISAGPNEASQSLQFIVTNSNNALFSAQPAIDVAGTLTYTPAVGVEGTATVSVRLKDNGGTSDGGSDTSAVQTFTIIVTDTLTWLGAAAAGGTNWHLATNWDPPLLPIPTSNVFIQIAGALNERPTISDSDVAINSLSVGKGMTLTIESGRTLTVTSSCTIDGTVIIKGAFTCGALNASKGTIIYSGSGVVQSVQSAKYNNLVINNPSGVRLSDDATVNGTLTLTRGVLTTGISHQLTLGGNASINGGTSSSYIIGALHKIFNAPASSDSIKVLNVAAIADFIYPVGTANGFSPVKLSNINYENINGASLMVEAFEGAYPPFGTPEPTGLPINRLQRWWRLTNGSFSKPDVLKTDIEFKYLASDITAGAESSYQFFRIENGTALGQATNIDAANQRATINGVVAVNAVWTLAESVVVVVTAPITVTGRVVTQEGQGVANATITVIGQNGEIRQTRTNPFGYYRLLNMTANANYTLKVTHKTLLFAEQTVTIGSVDLSNLNFIAVPR